MLTNLCAPHLMILQNNLGKFLLRVRNAFCDAVKRWKLLSDPDFLYDDYMGSPFLAMGAVARLHRSNILMLLPWTRSDGVARLILPSLPSLIHHSMWQCPPQPAADAAASSKPKRSRKKSADRQPAPAPEPAPMPAPAAGPVPLLQRLLQHGEDLHVEVLDFRHREALMLPLPPQQDAAGEHGVPAYPPAACCCSKKISWAVLVAEVDDERD